MAARRSRSARICFSIASWIVGGGSTDFSSTRLMRIPHLPVVDVVARGQRVLERHAADHVAQRGYGQLLDRLQGVGHLVRRGLGVGDREVQDGVDSDDQVVLCDDRLGCERDDLLAQVDHRLEPVHERDEDRQAGVEGALVAAQPLDDASAGLRNDADGPCGYEQHEHGDDDQHDQSSFHRSSSVAR
jgi:hypothetical protein